MNVFYEEDGTFRAAAVLADNDSSLQIESPHGKRSKIKGNAVMLRFERPGAADFMTGAQAMADELDVDFLWQCRGPEEFSFADMARDYYGHEPTPTESAAVLIRLHGSPMYFYKKGRGRYKTAPEENLRAALSGMEKRRRQEEQKARWIDQLTRGELPAEFPPLVDTLLFKPDRNALEWKALDAACAITHSAPARLLARCGALRSSYDYHLNRFLFENFPEGTAFPDYEALQDHPELPLAPVHAFSIDDASTTEIDDAFSVAALPDGSWRVGIHIAAPSLGFVPGSALDAIARRRLSTIYMPGGKFTMLPDPVIGHYTLCENQECPSVSMYLTLRADDLSVLHVDNVVERVHIAANLRHEGLEAHFNADALAGGAGDYPFKTELDVLWRLANALEAARGKADKANQYQDYNFRVEDDRVWITARPRGTPIDKVVSELMIHVNTEWGRTLSEAGAGAIYRTQHNGKVIMSGEPGPHDGLGVKQYAWSSSPLRRYVDLINQRQLVALLRNEPLPYGAGNDVMLGAMRDFELAYDLYNEFQRGMERYWCLRFIEQEGIATAPAVVLRESLVKLAALPLVLRVSSLPEFAPGSEVTVELSQVDLWDLTVNAQFRAH